MDIGIEHTFSQAEEEKEVYKCTGFHSEPFNGFILCKDNELPRHECGGQLCKVFKATRQVHSNQKTEKCFLRHLKIKNPLPLPPHRRFKAREISPILRITDKKVPNVEKAQKRTIDQKLVSAIRNLPTAVFESCPFCDSRLPARGALRDHLDVCFGKAP